MAASVVVDQTAMATRDNVRLATEVWLSSAGGPRPAMLVRTPYGLPGARGATDPVGLAQAGWAVVLQDVRGRGGSDGEFEPYHQEILDGSDAISWCAAQPWCSGDVVTSGASYVGLTQWQAASTGPKALRAITPSITAPRVRDSFIYVGEAFQYATATQWALDIAATSPRLPAAKRRKAERLRTALSQLATTPPAGNGVADVFPAYGRWVDYDDTDYWRPIDVSRSYRKIDVPGYHVGGWHDIFSEGTIEGYLGMRTAARSEYARTNQRLVMGPWAHVGVYQANTSDWDFGPTATGLGRFPAELNEFLRASIDRRDVPTGAAVYVMGVNRWLDFADWPPPSEPTTLFLGGEASSNSGLLSRERPEVGRMDRYEHDPKDPVPTRGGRTLGAANPLAGPTDQRLVEQRPDVLVYTSEPLRAEQWVVGEVTAQMWFASTSSLADVTVKLVDVHPNGLALNVVDGIKRTRPASARARKVSVSVGSTAHCFRPGHRIRIEVASSNSPRFDCAPAGEQSLHHGGRAASFVELPVIPTP